MAHGVISLPRSKSVAFGIEAAIRRRAQAKLLSLRSY